MSHDVLRGAIKAGDEVRIEHRWYKVDGRGIYGWLFVHEVPEHKPESRSKIHSGDVAEVRHAHNP